ncbi:hypothetical protein [Roseovarius tolerans]|uniref:hypothetical protein n=1 Tax=Roseovarius tolerans TaxID=74031 RepID=UPI0015872CF3|nr:hypothetical protein [Roseovarius tolerans]
MAEDYVLLDTFVASAEATRKAVEALNREFFNNELQFEFVIFPPESGSLKQYVGVVFKGVKKLSKQIAPTAVILWAIIQVMDSETTQDLTQEYLGGTPNEMLIEKIDAFKNKIKYLESSSDEQINDVETEYLQQEGTALLEEIVSRSASQSLLEPVMTFESARASKQLRYDLEDAQADLYGAALNDPTVRGIGFSEEEEFPIERNSFAERAIRPTVLKEEDPEIDWIVSLRIIRVTSPNFDRDDQSSRRWKGRDSSGHSVLFEVVDEEFWHKLLRDELEFGEATVLKVQMASSISKSRAKENKVIRVLAIDEEELAEPLQDEALSAVLGSFSHEQKRATPDLFDDNASH